MPLGLALSCRGSEQEGALRCLLNNLDPAVAERPDELVVYGGHGKAARGWPSLEAIVRSLRRLGVTASPGQSRPAHRGCLAGEPTTVESRAG